MDGVDGRSDYFSDEQIAQLRTCRQGDILAFKTQVWIASGDIPTTAVAVDRTEPGRISGLYESAPAGVAVLTQTCDLAPRPGRHRPFVAVAPLVKLDDRASADAKRGRRPQYAHIPDYAEGEYFADLDRITTIEVGVLLSAERSRGLNTDAKRASFASAVARKFGRFAFPDELSEALQRWRENVVSKHNKEQSPEGSLYRKALDVRVTGEPSWESDAIDVTIAVIFPAGFLPPTDPDFNPAVGGVDAASRKSTADIAQTLIDGVADSQLGVMYCDRLQSEWSARCSPSGKIASISFELVGADEMTVDAYLTSYSLDLEFLSSGS